MKLNNFWGFATACISARGNCHIFRTVTNVEEAAGNHP